MRWHYRLEWQAQRLLARPLARGQTALAALLRVGLLQLQELRIPEHAAVSATVDAAALLGARSASGLVNAVLRRFQREREQLEQAALERPEARFAHPRWLIEALRADHPRAWAVDSRRQQRRSAAVAARELAAHDARGVSREARGRRACRRRRAGRRLGRARCAARRRRVAAGFAAGEVSVQDVSAQRAARCSSSRPGQRVLDACAAPGGKTGHILEAAGGRSEVWAVDRDAARVGRVRENLDRLGLTAKLVTGDATAPQDWWDGRPFDRILIDAPCSATGVIRRHPDIKVLRRPADVDRVIGLQARLLRALWPLLAPGGRLVYATCSVLRRENDAQIAAFRAEEPAIEPSEGVASLQLLARGGGRRWLLLCLVTEAARVAYAQWTPFATIACPRRLPR